MSCIALSLVHVNKENTPTFKGESQTRRQNNSPNLLVHITGVSRNMLQEIENMGYRNI